MNIQERVLTGIVWSDDCVDSFYIQINLFFLTYLPYTQITSSTCGNDVKFCSCSKKLNGIVEIVHRKGSWKVWAEMQVDSKADQAKLRAKRLQAATLSPAIKIGWGKRTSYLSSCTRIWRLIGKGLAGKLHYTVIGRLFVYLKNLRRRRGGEKFLNTKWPTVKERRLYEGVLISP